MNRFDKNAIRFQYPTDWSLVEEEWDEEISALTFEDGDGIYMIDIYHSKVGPDIQDYAKRHYQCFVQELPLFSKVVSGPSYTNVNEHGVSGLVLEYIIKTSLIFKAKYVNPIYRLQGSNCVSFISGQYSKADSVRSGDSLNQVIGSFSAC